MRRVRVSLNGPGSSRWFPVVESTRPVRCQPPGILKIRSGANRLSIAEEALFKAGPRSTVAGRGRIFTRRGEGVDDGQVHYPNHAYDSTPRVPIVARCFCRVPDDRAALSRVPNAPQCDDSNTFATRCF